MALLLEVLFHSSSQILDFLDRTQPLQLAKERNIAYVTPVLVEGPGSITPQDRHPGSLGKE